MMDTRLFMGQKGQAAIEFLIAAVFILVPLFLTIPLLGKYIDIRHAAVQQARFEAWEYTAWMGPSEKAMFGLEKNPHSGRKSYEKTRAQGLRYFFSDPHDKSYGKSYGKTWSLNKLWQDHHGEWLFAENHFNPQGLQEDASPDPTRGVANFIFATFSYVYKQFRKLTKSMKVDAGFNAVNNQGFFHTQVSMHLRSPGEIMPNLSLAGIESTPVSTLNIEAKAGVQSIYWNSGGTKMAVSQSRGLVFSSALSPVSDTLNKIINKLHGALNVIGKVLPISITLPHLPDFGYVNDNLVPYEHLSATSQDGKGAPILPRLHEATGLYYYQE
ncbi:MAG: hypothetical protein KKC20_01185 [Proteobacteria bacterium]|nr:hypothetical protein [Pseudomonadota bacterium]